MTTGRLDLSRLPELTIWAEVQTERDRAHEKWKNSNNGSMERMPFNSDRRMTIITEEVGEAAKELNDYWLAISALQRARRQKKAVRALRHEAYLCLQRLRAELIQVAAMSGAWAEKLGEVVDL